MNVTVASGGRTHADRKRAGSFSSPSLWISKCKWLFDRFMAEGFPPGQLQVIDLVIRMACQPKFEIDRDVLVTQSEPMSQPILKRLGFEVVGEISVMIDRF